MKRGPEPSLQESDTSGTVVVCCGNAVLSSARTLGRLGCKRLAVRRTAATNRSQDVAFVAGYSQTISYSPARTGSGVGRPCAGGLWKTTATAPTTTAADKAKRIDGRKRDRSIPTTYLGGPRTHKNETREETHAWTVYRSP